ncbi:retrovirus-related pol polyprotein from transposon TNT 1-94 [Tanacetum coccineum]
MILSEDIRRRNSKEYLNFLLSATGNGRKSNRGRLGSRKKSPSENTGNITCWNYGQKGHIKSQCETPKGVVNVSADIYDDALLCCVKQYCESWVMDLGASFHATSCMGTMKNFKQLLGKVSLANMKVLDVAGIRDVVLKTTFGIEWILKNVRQLGVKLRKRLRVKLCNRLHRQIYAPRPELRENSTWEPLRLDLVSLCVLSIIVESLGTSKGLGTKESVKASGSLGASGSSVNRLSLYVCTYLGILISGKEDLACVETLYGWAVGFDECRSLVRLRRAFSRIEEGG